ncbi:unnamed protein product [Prunus armeniaca]|uniref:25S rRNA (uridine-N(3))-methyltransferase BMT5-like domain-containing protein n=1 Tax=Prunus armeniaca TaxID=36596 RepID=A0A6J5X8I4_PRUAR|nr:unnamed protein product [Prunus armeniaca]CAB4307374.1 unnamed protein product [Prunus armeniaca]
MELFGYDEKWIKHCRSSQKIPLVGEGDFSFSACLARAFGSAADMVATSRLQRFHQNLVMGYLKSSSEMLTRSGEIHVTHRTSYPFTDWEMEKLTEEVGLFLVKEEEFSPWDYPGYKSKRGVGKCDQNFHVGESSTFIFAKRLYPRAASSFHPGALSISLWSADIVDMACTYIFRELRKEETKAWPQEFEIFIRFEDFQDHNPHYYCWILHVELESLLYLRP